MSKLKSLNYFCRNQGAFRKSKGKKGGAEVITNHCSGCLQSAPPEVVGSVCSQQGSRLPTVTDNQTSMLNKIEMEENLIL